MDDVAGQGHIQGPVFLLNHERAGIHVESRAHAAQSQKNGGCCETQQTCLKLEPVCYDFLTKF